LWWDRCDCEPLVVWPKILCLLNWNCLHFLLTFLLFSGNDNDENELLVLIVEEWWWSENAFMANQYKHLCISFFMLTEISVAIGCDQSSYSVVIQWLFRGYSVVIQWSFSSRSVVIQLTIDRNTKYKEY